MIRRKNDIANNVCIAKVCLELPDQHPRHIEHSRGCARQPAQHFAKRKKQKGGNSEHETEYEFFTEELSEDEDESCPFDSYEPS